MNRILISLLSLICFAAVGTTSAQTFVRDLAGFRLGQYRDATHRDLGQPDQQGNTDENTAYEAFLLSEEPMLYMVFQYRKTDPDTIWSIQVTGADPKYDIGFRGLRLTALPAEVEKILGKPREKIDVSEHGIRWEFSNTNYSVEIGKDNRLSSVRIVDEPLREPDVKNLPQLKDVIGILQAGTNAELGNLLAPDIELYEGDKVLAFESSMKNEIASDGSGVFATVRKLSKELSFVDQTKADQYDVKMRVRPGRDLLHVIQLPKLKTVTEITFKWNGERWQIWEFGAKKAPPQPQDWKSIYTPGSLKDLVSKRIPDLIKNPNVALTKEGGKPLAGLSYNSYPTSTRVRFTGEIRNTPDSTRTLIELWLVTLGKSKELANRFEFEFKVVEQDKEYWLPIQNPIPDRLKKEVKTNDEITIYLSWIGIKYENDRPELLAIVNEFTK